MAKTTSPLGAKIKERLDAVGKTQAWLAEQLELSNNAVSKWISGASEPKFSNLRDMSIHLKCSVGFLAGDKDSDSPRQALTKNQETILCAFEVSSQELKDEWLEQAERRIEKAEKKIPEQAVSNGRQ